jgi:SAM-dependent methyltransferase
LPSLESSASPEQSNLFDAHYYATGCGRPYQRDEAWLDFFRTIARRIVQEIRPRTALDAGCALGLLVEGLRLEGVEADGVDISEYAIQTSHPDVKPYLRLGSIADPFPQKYHLIISIEVLEHMPPREAERAIENICASTEDVLFSSTPFDYKEATHFNVQPPEYWADRFAMQGFFRDVDFDASFITPWAVRFRRKNEPVHRIVRDYERKYWLLGKENSDLRSQVTEMTGQLQSWDARFADLEKNATWRMLQKLQAWRKRLAPEGSRRERWLARLLYR